MSERKTVNLCSHCGSESIDVGYWVNQETGKIAIMQYPLGRVWCNNCEMHSNSCVAKTVLTIRTLTEFIFTKRQISGAKYNEEFGEGIVESEIVYVYSDSMCIEVEKVDMTKPKIYSLSLGNNTYTSQDLHLLERRLWDDFAKYEIGLSKDEIEADLHIRALELLEQLGQEDCSLDEVQLSDLDDHEQLEVEYLLKQFEEL